MQKYKFISIKQHSINKLKVMALINRAIRWAIFYRVVTRAAAWKWVA